MKSIYIGIIVFQLLKHSEEVDIKHQPYIGAQHLYWGRHGPLVSPTGYGLMTLLQLNSAQNQPL